MSQFRDFLPARGFKEQGLQREQEWEMHLDQMAQQESANKLAKIGMILDAVKTIGSLGTGITGLSQGQQQIDLAKGAQEFEQGPQFDFLKSGQAFEQKSSDWRNMLGTMELDPSKYQALSNQMGFGNPTNMDFTSMLPAEAPQPRLNNIDLFSAMLGGATPGQLKFGQQMMQNPNVAPNFNEMYGLDPKFMDLTTAIKNKNEMPAELQQALPTQRYPTFFSDLFKYGMGPMARPNREGDRAEYEKQKKLWEEYLRSQGYIP